ncbi:MAG: hypothetical protein RIC53_08400 [Cyclobacteriaceae bacterium]
MDKSKIILSVIAVFVVTIAWSQPGAPPATPIDGGLSALLAAGGIYGLKKIRDSRKKG